MTEGDVYSVESKAILGVKLFPEGEVLASAERLKRLPHVTAVETAPPSKDGATLWVKPSGTVMRELTPGRFVRMVVGEARA